MKNSNRGTSTKPSGMGGGNKKAQDCKSALSLYISSIKENDATPISVEEIESVHLHGQYPSITVMDSSLQQLKKCHRLSLSTNAIDKIQNLSGLSIRILSLGRNNIKKLDGIEDISHTLEQLWISYNNIDRLNGIENLQHLKVLYISNNKISDWEEIDRLKCLPHLEDLLLIGNPIQRKYKGQIDTYRSEVARRLPNLRKLDGESLVEASSSEAE